MKISQKAEKCGLSPMRKFHPYAVRAEKAGKQIFRLNIGQPDIPTPAVYFDVLRDIHFPVLGYAPSPGLPILIDALRTYYRKIGVSFENEEILITTGGSEALQIVLLCMLDEGDEVLIPEPFYPNYSTMVCAAGGVIRPIPTSPEEGYRYADRARIEGCINERTRAILLSNPGNPTGVVLTPEEMRLLADIAKEHGLFLIGDEVYREFCYGAQMQPRSFAQMEDVAQNVVIIDSVSKRFSACGARVGAILSKNETLIFNAMKFCQSRLSVATLDQLGAAALYGVEPNYFAAVRAEYQKRRDVCYRMLKQIPGVVCENPDGAFYMMAKLPVDDAEKFQIWMLETFEDRKQTVMFAPGRGFYATEGSGINEVRIAYVLEQNRLERAMELLKEAVRIYRETVMCKLGSS